MSLRPVFGRSRAEAFVWIRWRYFGSMSSRTIARPSLRLTLPIEPTCTPAIRTVWPCPGVTACAVVKAAFIVNGFGEMNGKRSRSCERM